MPEEKLQAAPEPEKPQEKEEKATNKRKTYMAKLTSESLAALFDQGSLVVGAPCADIRLRLDRFDDDTDLENLESAAADLENRISALREDLLPEDEDDDEDYDEDADEDEEDEDLDEDEDEDEEEDKDTSEE